MLGIDVLGADDYALAGCERRCDVVFLGKGYVQARALTEN